MRGSLLRALGLGLIAGLAALVATSNSSAVEDSESLPAALIDGQGPGWRPLGAEDFTDVNLGPDAWTWKDGLGHCRGTPVGVIRTRKPVTNFELVARWRHLAPGGNSGIFVWAPEKALDGLKPGNLPPGGIEVQVLDHGYADQYQKDTGKKPDWFTTNGDVFPVGTSKMKPFPPLSPDGSRSFPRENRSKGLNEWNHYYVRAINGEIRLWVNGKEVSGGSHCEPATGYLCLESEGSPVEFKDIRIRELPVKACNDDRRESIAAGRRLTGSPRSNRGIAPG